MGVNYCEIMM